jgi:carbamoyltransferase
MDGVGEWDTTTVYSGSGRELKKIKEMHFPHSLGLLYSAFTYYCGFKVNSGEYKLMGLAPYGKPRFASQIKKHLIDIKEDGSFRLDMSYFDYCTGLTMTNKKFDDLFENNYRAPEQELQQVHMDLAASIQVVLEEIIVKIVCELKATHNAKNLCLAGGVALNCVANGKIHKLDLFENIWIQPAAGDAGGALGAALAAYHLHLKNSRTVDKTDSMQGAYLGPQYSTAEIEKALTDAKAVFRKTTHGEAEQFTAHELIAGKVIGWFQGRSEFGPRALGNRSIIADARNSEMQKKLNMKIKFRESFRPFAPAVLESDVNDWFEFDRESPYMLMVANVKKSKLLSSPYNTSRTGLELLNETRSQVPAITHVDNSARIQTVSARTNARFHSLLSLFRSKTGTPLLINTSFNIRGEPIVNSPADAYRCFMGTDMDVLIIENFILVKEDQPHESAADYRKDFKLD